MNTTNTGSGAYLGPLQRRQAPREDRPVAEPKPGWPNELASRQYRARLTRPVRTAERGTSDQARTVDGIGIFTLSPDNTIIRSDDPGYPSTDAYARYRWVAS